MQARLPSVLGPGEGRRLGDLNSQQVSFPVDPDFDWMPQPAVPGDAQTRDFLSYPQRLKLRSFAAGEGI